MLQLSCFCSDAAISSCIRERGSFTSRAFSTKWELISSGVERGQEERIAFDSD